MLPPLPLLALFDKKKTGKKRKTEAEERTQKKLKKFQEKKMPRANYDSDDDGGGRSRGKAKHREGGKHGKGRGKVGFKTHEKIRKAKPTGMKMKKKGFKRK